MRSNMDESGSWNWEKGASLGGLKTGVRTDPSFWKQGNGRAHVSESEEVKLNQVGAPEGTR